jgi:diguanylate cyclase (GGDEF)-like protein/PAS domain S-box-containing protein
MNKSRAPHPPRTGLDEPAAGVPTRPMPTAHLVDQLTLDLHIHQIELEMQNEALRLAQLELTASRDRYVDLYDHAPAGYLSLSVDGLIVEANLTGAALLGIERSRLVGGRFAHRVAKVDEQRWHRYAVALARDGGETQRIELQMTGADGASFHARIDGARVAAAAQRPALRITLINIDEHKRAEAELRLAAVAFETQEGIMITDANGVIERVNAAFTKITGYSAQEAIGQRGDLMHSGLQDAAFYEVMWAHLKTKGRWQGEVWNRRKSGEVYPQWLAITEVSFDGDRPQRYVGTMIDITDRKAREEEIAQLAFYDPLTDLPNRRLMKDRLQQALVASGRLKREGALMFIDLDRFKEINDTLGHDKGDRLLQRAALRLVACVREGDTVARIGGDEFVVMLPPGLSESPDESAVLAEAIADKILKSMREPYVVDGLVLHVSASIGIALFGEQPTSVEELLKRADQAMYQAKAAGRDTLRFFDVAAQDSLRTRSFIEADLRVALAQGQLLLNYQPVFNVARKMIGAEAPRRRGAEALVRWQHPQRGLLLPDDFVSIAEDSGLIFPLGQWALDAACAQLALWRDDAVLGQLTVAVNVCSLQLLDHDFVAQVLAVVQRHGVNPARLKFELTESVLLHDVDDTIAKMRELQSHGVGFSLDDFGTGYSSLAYLKRLPLDQLKIDRSFVRDMLNKPHDAAIVRTIVELGVSLGLTVVAEGVETVSQCEVLAHLGCQGFQGRLFGMPMSPDELRALANSEPPVKAFPQD